jgi:hypothetical protein
MNISFSPKLFFFLPNTQILEINSKIKRRKIKLSLSSQRLLAKVEGFF